MIDTWLQEPILQFISQWPFVGVLMGALWLMRKDIKDCLRDYRDLVDRVLEKKG